MKTKGKTMVGMIALSEVLDFRSADANCYGGCSECGRLLRRRHGRYVRCCGRAADVAVSTVGEVLQIKRTDPEFEDLMESIRLHGIGLPVLIYHGEVQNGHHRIAAAVDLGITEIPWTNDSSIGWEEDWPDDSVLDCGA